MKAEPFPRRFKQRTPTQEWESAKGLTAIPYLRSENDGYDDSGLHSDMFEGKLFEDFVASRKYQRNVRKIMKPQNKPKKNPNGMYFKPKEVPDVLSPEN